MYHVKCVDRIDEGGIAALGDGFTVVEGNEKADVILVRSSKLSENDIDGDVIAIARAGTGVNNIPVEWCSEHGITVFNTPGANANAVKELTLCGLLMCSRRVIDGAEWVKNLHGSEAEIRKEIERGKKNFAGPEIFGKVLGVVGLGAIGKSVAEAAAALGMTVVACDPFVQDSGGVPLLGLDELFEVSDYISLHLPLNDRTHGLIGSEILSKAKHGARLLNFSRGEIADSEAILNELESGRLAAYVTDFPDSRLIGANGVVALPHLGASTPESERRCAVMVACELREYIESGIVRNSVNLAEMSLPKPDNVGRICIMHGSERIDREIKTACESFGGTLVNMLSRFKNGNGYTIVDIDGVSETDIEKIAEILKSVENVRRIRISV